MIVFSSWPLSSSQSDVAAEPHVDVLDHRGVVPARAEVLLGRERARVVVGKAQSLEDALGAAHRPVHLARDVHRRVGTDEVHHQVPRLVLRRLLQEVEAVPGQPVVAVRVRVERRRSDVSPPAFRSAGASPGHVPCADRPLRRLERVQVGVVRVARADRLPQVGHAGALAGVVDHRGRSPRHRRGSCRPDPSRCFPSTGPACRRPSCG